MRGTLTLLSVGLLFAACSDYDLNRPDDAKGKTVYDTGEPEGDWPDIEVTPMSLNFGTLPKDCESDPQTVTIRNVGVDDLVVSDIQVGGSASTNFVLSASPPTLAPNEEYSFEVDFTATAWTTFNADIYIESNDPNEGSLAVELLGKGGEDAIYEEAFLQEVYEEVDILWVVDNSGSMSSAISAVEQNFGSFIDSFLSVGLDFQMAAVTTDMDDANHQGRFQGSELIIDSNHPNPKQLFLDMVSQGANGSPDERGLDAAKASLSAPLVNGFNAGFLRKDAALAAIVVTDEDDSSSIDPTAFANWFKGLKNDPTKVSFSAVCGDPGMGCTQLTNWSNGGLIVAGAGTAYLDVKDQTNGVWQSICSNDFGKVLDYLSLNVSGMTDTFVLAQIPSNIAQMVVEVDGVTVSYSGIDGFTYIVQENAVQFHSTSIPGPGSIISVSYPYASVCEN
jgi:hypothetical protein